MTVRREVGVPGVVEQQRPEIVRILRKGPHLFTEIRLAETQQGVVRLTERQAIRAAGIEHASVDGVVIHAGAGQLLRAGMVHHASGGDLRQYVLHSPQRKMKRKHLRIKIRFPINGHTQPDARLAVPELQFPAPRIQRWMRKILEDLDDAVMLPPLGLPADGLPLLYGIPDHGQTRFPILFSEHPAVTVAGKIADDASGNQIAGSFRKDRESDPLESGAFRPASGIALKLPETLPEGRLRGVGKKLELPRLPRRKSSAPEPAALIGNPVAVDPRPVPDAAFGTIPRN